MIFYYAGNSQNVGNGDGNTMFLSDGTHEQEISFETNGQMKETLSKNLAIYMSSVSIEKRGLKYIVRDDNNPVLKTHMFFAIVSSREDEIVYVNQKENPEIKVIDIFGNNEKTYLFEIRAMNAVSLFFKEAQTDEGKIVTFLPYGKIELTMMNEKLNLDDYSVLSK